MICSECQKEGKKSRVTGGAGATTCMYFAPYWDEEGRQHDHDGNITTYSYSCSNGHVWTEQKTGSCWCGWGAKEV
jgi:hypothetical protein